MKVSEIILFDMDGTLTEPREEAGEDIMEALYDLSKEAEVGIVTGSDIDYIQEQIKTFSYEFGDWGMVPDYQRDKPVITHILPCNGTKYYRYNSMTLELELKHSNSMEIKLGKKTFKTVLEKLFQLQLDVVNEFPDIPLTGKFFNYRDSMINWCPIGRNAEELQRNEFVTLDKKTGLRKKFLNNLQTWVKNGRLDVTVALGGQTSFDIYPDGWSKKYALQHFNDEVCFVGDKCDGDGNDAAIYNAVNEDKRFKVRCPEDTIELIYDTLVPMLKNDC